MISNERQYFKTIGFSFFHSTDLIVSTVKKIELVAYSDHVSKYFSGAGCSSNEMNQIV